jgi:hypothetical protein
MEEIFLVEDIVGRFKLNHSAARSRPPVGHVILPLRLWAMEKRIPRPIF